MIPMSITTSKNSEWYCNMDKLVWLLPDCIFVDMTSTFHIRLRNISLHYFLTVVPEVPPPSTRLHQSLWTEALSKTPSSEHLSPSQLWANVNCPSGKNGRCSWSEISPAAQMVQLIPFTSASYCSNWWIMLLISLSHGVRVILMC